MWVFLDFPPGTARGWGWACLWGRVVADARATPGPSRSREGRRGYLVTSAWAQSSQWRQRLDIGGVDRRAAPDAQARRGIAIGADVIGAPFPSRAATTIALTCSSLVPGSVRQTLVLEREAGVLGQMRDPGGLRHPAVERRGIGIGAGHQLGQAADMLRPFQRVDIVLDRQHRRRVDRLAVEDAFDQLALGGQAEDLRQRPGRRVAFQALDRAGAEDQHAVRAFAAQHLLPASRSAHRSCPRACPARTRRWSRRRGSGPRGRRGSSRRSARARPRWCRSR